MEEGERRRDKHYDVKQRGYRQSVIIPPLLSSSCFSNPPVSPSWHGPSFGTKLCAENPKANAGRPDLFTFTAACFVYVMRTGAVNSSLLPPQRYKRRHAAYGSTPSEDMAACRLGWWWCVWQEKRPRKARCMKPKKILQATDSSKQKQHGR